MILKRLPPLAARRARWWECRWCRRGEHGLQVSVQEEKARCLAHEMNCPHRWKLVLAKCGHWWKEAFPPGIKLDPLLPRVCSYCTYDPERASHVARSPQGMAMVNVVYLPWTPEADWRNHE